MSVMTSFTLRSLARNRVRTAVSVVGIALSCALITAVFTVVASLNGALYERTMQTEGSWHIFAEPVADEALDALDDERVTRAATSQEIGSAAFSGADAESFGIYLVVKTAPAAAKGSFDADGAPLTLVPEIEEGRMPQAEGEIALPTLVKGETLGAQEGAGVRSDGPIEEGSTLTLSLGQRRGTDPVTGEPIVKTATSAVPPEEYGEAETLEDVQERTFTVVGFYNRMGHFAGNDFAANANGITGIVAPDASAALGTTSLWVATQGFSRVADLHGFAEDELGVGDAIVHTNLLRYEGVQEDRAAADSLFVIGCTLAAVVAAAGVSLIYNSFSISVAERTRLFGVLASIGASKRQLRRSVLFEAAALGIVGIPLGIALGIGGTGATFSLVGEALASSIGMERMALVVSPAALAGCALLCAAILLASAWAPSRRASRVSAVDAIRQTQDVRMTRRALRRLRRAQASEGHHANIAPFSKAGLAGRLFGVSGAIARRNRERASSRGRTVTASLAVSVALLIVCGSVALYLEPFANQAGSASGAKSDADIVVSGMPASLDDYTDDYERYNGALQELIARAQDIEGVEFAGTVKQGQCDAVIPASMLDGQARELHDSKYESISAEWVPSIYSSEGDYLRDVMTFYLDETSWSELVESIGADPALFADAEHPRAIGLNTYRGQTRDGRWFDMPVFSGTGTAELYTLAENDLDDPWRVWGMAEDENGEMAVYEMNMETNEDRTTPLEGRIEKTFDLEIVALADEQPASLAAMAADSHYPALIMPDTVCDTASERGMGDMFGYSFINARFTADDHARAAEEIEGLVAEYGDVLALYVTDVTEQAQAGRMLVQAIELFVLLFSLILALVAVANVFNTLTNSIILRTREFAVLKSVGMGERAFAKMLLCECLGFALRGFIIGLIAATAATYAIYYGMSFSFASLPFTMPWAYVAAALGVTLAVLAISVAFALHRSRAGSIVDALRAEAL